MKGNRECLKRELLYEHVYGGVVDKRSQTATSTQLRGCCLIDIRLLRGIDMEADLYEQIKLSALKELDI
jgi:hypothetical protein